MDLAKQIGGRVRDLRTRQGLTLEQLSELSGLPPESISRLERGRTVASLRSLARIAKGLGVALVDMVAEVDGPTISVEGIPIEARTVALRLGRCPPVVRDKARRILEILIENEEAQESPAKVEPEPANERPPGRRKARKS